MKKSNFAQIVVPAVVLFVICAVVTALLAGTNALTYDTIQSLNQQAEDEARRKVLPDAANFAEASNDTKTYYIGMADDGITRVGYVFITETDGYGGKIRVMTGIEAAESGTDAKVTGVEILSHDETPGLGANAIKDSFTGQFKQDVKGDAGFTLFGEEMGVDALTGATITSRSVVEAVNQAIFDFNQIQEGANTK